MKCSILKRMISFLLMISMILGIGIPALAAEEDNHPESIGLNNFFKNGYDTSLLDHSVTGHMTFVEDMRGKVVGTLAMEVLAKIYGEEPEPTEAKYMEVLINIMTTYEMENAANISQQCKMDTLKSAESYALDAVKVGTGLLFAAAKADGATTKLMDWIEIAVGGLETVGDNTENWIEGLSDLNALLQNYAKHDAFLYEIESLATGELQSAAIKLRTTMKSAMKIKLESYSDITEANFQNYSEFFFKDVFFEALELTEEYATDEGFKFFVDLGSDVLEVISLYDTLKLGVEIGKFVGNIAVNGEDIVNRVLEMKAVYDISIILEGWLKEVKARISTPYSDVTDNRAINYVRSGNYLISCRIRGEYCMYSLLAKDSGLYSHFGEATAKQAENVYNSLTSKLEELKKQLDGVLNVLVVNVGSEMPYEAVNTKSQWNVYGKNGKPYDNYTLRIYDKQSLINFMHTGPMDEPDPTVTEHVVDSTEPLVLTLEEGYAYTFEFVDNEDPNQIVLMTVGVTDSDPKLTTVLDIETHFGRFQLDSILNNNGLVFLTEEPYESHSNLFDVQMYPLTGEIFGYDHYSNRAYSIRTMFPYELNVIAQTITPHSSIKVYTDTYEDPEMDVVDRGEQMVIGIPGTVNMFRNDLSLQHDIHSYYYVIEGANTDYLICESLSASQTRLSGNNYYLKTGSALPAKLTERIEIINMQDYQDTKSFFAEYSPDGDFSNLCFYESVGYFGNDELLFSADNPEAGKLSDLAEVTEYIHNELGKYGLGDRVLEAASNLGGHIPLLVSKVSADPTVADIKKANSTPIGGFLWIGGVGGETTSSVVPQIRKDDLLGTWYCSEIDKAYVFTSTGMDFAANLQSVDGSYVEMDLKNRDTEFGGFDLDNEYGTVVFHTIGSESFTISLQNQTLTIDGVSYQKVDSSLQEQIIGTWKSENGFIRFDGDEYLHYIDGEQEGRDGYYVLSDTILAVWSSGSYRKYEYEIDGNLLYYRYDTYKLSE